MSYPIIDFHSHILPGIDDGSQSVSESIAMLQQLKEQGIGHVVATPHFYPNHDSPERFLKRRRKAEEALRQELLFHPLLPEITIGAEVYFFPGMSDSDILPQLTIGQKRCILIEMPQSPWTERMYRELEWIYTKQGLVPVIAHVDRYIAPFKTHKIPQRLTELPVVVQANADFFLKRSTARMAMGMLQKDQIQLLGSDCHNLTYRAPRLGEALEKIEKRLGADTLARIASCQEQLLAE